MKIFYCLLLSLMAIAFTDSKCAKSILFSPEPLTEAQQYFASIPQSCKIEAFQMHKFWCSISSARGSFIRYHLKEGLKETGKEVSKDAAMEFENDEFGVSMEKYSNFLIFVHFVKIKRINEYKLDKVAKQREICFLE